MNNQQLVLALRDEFEQWEALLGGLSEAETTAPLVPESESIKDKIAHLRAWQQRSIARLDAARLNQKPVFPPGTPHQDSETDEGTNQINAWIYDFYRDQSWTSVYQQWHDGFEQFIALAAAIPPQDLSDTKKYPWLDGYALSDVLAGSLEHHQEHRQALLDWLPQNKK